MSKLYLVKDFTQEFSFIYANTDTLKHKVYQLRSANDDVSSTLNIDQYDTLSHHILIKHKATQTYAACTRIIEPPTHKPEMLLPMEKKFKSQLWVSGTTFECLPRKSFSELSQLYIAASFTQETPKIMLSLYLASISLARLLFHDYIFAEIPEETFKKMRVQGLLFEQTIETTQTKQNNLYCLNLEQGISATSPSYELYQHILNEMAHQLNIPFIQDSDSEDIRLA